MNCVVLTGATSMIGIALIQNLIENQTKKIYAVVQKKSTKLIRLPESNTIEVIECNIDNYSNLTELINETCDVFYHFAWQATGGSDVRNTMIDKQCQNIGFTLDAIHAAHELGCKKFIGAGSQAEYGLLDLEKIAPDSPVNPIQPYGIAKYAAGKLARAEAEILHMDCLWIRIFSVFGVYDRPDSLVSGTIRTLLNNNKPSFTPARQRWDYLDARDAGRAFYLTGLKATGNKVYCLGSGRARSLQSFIEDIRNAINPNLPLGIGDMPYPSNCVMNLCADISSLTEDTGWIPQIEFKDGIAEMVRIYAKE